MMINRKNYEKYALDFLEGNLAPQAEQAMQRFLRQNPDVAEELEGLKEIVLVPDESIVFADKESLKRKGRRVALPFLNRPMVRTALVAASLMGVFFIGQQFFPTEEEAVTPIVRNADTPATNSMDTEIINEEKLVAEENVTMIKKTNKIKSPQNEVIAAQDRKKEKTAIIKEEKSYSIAKVPGKIKASPSIKETNPQEIETRLVESTAPEIIEAPAIVKVEKPIPPKEEIIEVPPMQEEEIVAMSSPEEESIIEEPQEPAQEKALAIVEHTRKKARRVVFFPKIKDKLSPKALREALLPESLSRQE